MMMMMIMMIMIFPMISIMSEVIDGYYKIIDYTSFTGNEIDMNYYGTKFINNELIMLDRGKWEGSYAWYKKDINLCSLYDDIDQMYVFEYGLIGSGVADGGTFCFQRYGNRYFGGKGGNLGLGQGDMPLFNVELDLWYSGEWHPDTMGAHIGLNDGGIDKNLADVNVNFIDGNLHLMKVIYWTISKRLKVIYDGVELFPNIVFVDIPALLGMCNAIVGFTASSGEETMQLKFTSFSIKTNVWNCHGLPSIDDNVCSLNGKCVDQNTCLCNYGYTGQQCQDWSCFGLQNYAGNVCGGHGTCESIDKCKCDDENYSGVECYNWFCNGVDSRNESVCSGNGICGSHDTCICSCNYEGFNCENFIDDNIHVKQISEDNGGASVVGVVLFITIFIILVIFLILLCICVTALCKKAKKCSNGQMIVPPSAPNLQEKGVINKV